MNPFRVCRGLGRCGCCSRISGLGARIIFGCVAGWSGAGAARGVPRKRAALETQTPRNCCKGWGAKTLKSTNELRALCIGLLQTVCFYNVLHSSGRVAAPHSHNDFGAVGTDAKHSGNTGLAPFRRTGPASRALFARAAWGLNETGEVLQRPLNLLTVATTVQSENPMFPDSIRRRRSSTHQPGA